MKKTVSWSVETIKREEEDSFNVILTSLPLLVLLLLLDNIGSTTNTSGPTAWKNSNGTDFVASENDIVEYDGNNWSIVLNASETADVVYTQNLATGIQYMWDGIEWSQSVDGFYPVATWRLDLDG